MSEKLLPCPFCGGKAGYARGGADFSPHGWNAGCVNGHAVSPDMETKTEAREWWNRRPKAKPAAPPEVIVDDLEAQVEFTLSDASRLLRKQDVQGACPHPHDCFYESDRVRCGPCAVKASAAKGVEIDDTYSHLPEVCRLRREVKTAQARIAELEAATPPQDHENASPPLQVTNPATIAQFVGTLSRYGVKLPLQATDDDIGTLVDDDGKVVLVVDVERERSDEDVAWIVGMIQVAVNTCGGFKATRAVLASEGRNDG